MPQRISARVEGFTESVIREMTRVVMEHGGVNRLGELGRTKIRLYFPKTDDVLQEAGERLLRLQA